MRHSLGHEAVARLGREIQNLQISQRSTSFITLQTTLYQKCKDSSCLLNIVLVSLENCTGHSRFFLCTGRQKNYLDNQNRRDHNIALHSVF
jgi:hypothetical protein